ncbi:MAG: hypothetical protein AAF490_12580, partial [Chloroflexota bacterium]
HAHAQVAVRVRVVGEHGDADARRGVLEAHAADEVVKLNILSLEWMLFEGCPSDFHCVMQSFFALSFVYVSVPNFLN